MLVMKYFNYRNVAVVATTDITGVPFSQAFHEAAKRANMLILESVSFEAGTTQFKVHLNALRDSRARIFVFFGGRNDFVLFMQNAIAAGLAGDGYQWFSTHQIGSEYVFALPNGKLRSDIPDITGFLALQYPTSPPTSASVKMYQEVQSLWRQQANLSQTSMVDLSSSKIPIATLHSFDCTIAFAHGLHDFIFNHGLDPTLKENRAAFMGAILNVTTNGTTGPMEFTESGDRLMRLEIVNYQGLQKGWVAIGTIEVDGQISMTHQVTWPGRGIKPSDAIPVSPMTQRYFTRGIVIGMIILSACGLIFGCVCIVGVGIYWKHPVVRSASPRLLICLIIGTMLLCSSIIPRALVNSDLSLSQVWDAKVCNAELFLLNLGYTAMSFAFLIKSYRLYRLYHRRTISRVMRSRWKNYIFIATWLSALMLQAVQLLGLILTVPIQSVPRGENQQYYLVCDVRPSDYVTASTVPTTTAVMAAESYRVNTLYIPIILSTRFALLLLATFCAFVCRKIGNGFGESTQLLYTLYNLTALSVLLPTLEQATGRGEDGPLIAYCISVFLIAVLTLVATFAPKMILILKKKVAHPSQPEVSFGLTVEQERERCHVAAIAGAAIDGEMNRNKNDNDTPTDTRAEGEVFTVEMGPIKSPPKPDSTNDHGSPSNGAIHGAMNDKDSVLYNDSTSNSSSSPDHVSLTACSQSSTPTLNASNALVNSSTFPPSPLSAPPSSLSLIPTSLTPTHVALLVEMFRDQLDENEVHQTIRRRLKNGIKNCDMQAVTSLSSAAATATSSTSMPRQLTTYRTNELTETNRHTELSHEMNQTADANSSIVSSSVSSSSFLSFQPAPLVLTRPTSHQMLIRVPSDQPSMSASVSPPMQCDESTSPLIASYNTNHAESANTNANASTHTNSLESPSLITQSDNLSPSTMPSPSLPFVVHSTPLSPPSATSPGRHVLRYHLPPDHLSLASYLTSSNLTPLTSLPSPIAPASASVSVTSSPIPMTSMAITTVQESEMERQQTVMHSHHHTYEHTAETAPTSSE